MLYFLSMETTLWKEGVYGENATEGRGKMFTKILYGAALLWLLISFVKDKAKTKLALKKYGGLLKIYCHRYWRFCF